MMNDNRTEPERTPRDGVELTPEGFIDLYKDSPLADFLSSVQNGVGWVARRADFELAAARPLALGVVVEALPSVRDCELYDVEDGAARLVQLPSSLDAPEVAPLREYLKLCLLRDHCDGLLALFH